MHKSSHIISSLKNLGINIAVDEVQKLVKYFLDIVDLIKVGHDQRVLGQKLLFLLFEPLVKLILDLCLLVLQLLLQVKESLIDVLHLLELESLQLFLHLLEQFAIFIVKSLCI